MSSYSLYLGCNAQNRKLIHEERVHIVELAAQGFSNRNVASRLSNLPRSGRQRITDAKTDSVLILNEDYPFGENMKKHIRRV